MSSATTAADEADIGRLNGRMAPNHALPTLFTIAPQYQARGYATEAVRLLVGYLFARGKHQITE